VAQPLRVAVTGGAISPPIDITVALLGPEKVRVRIGRALALAAAAPSG
jgi:glutamyl-tRNA synthetase